MPKREQEIRPDSDVRETVVLKNSCALIKKKLSPEEEREQAEIEKSWRDCQKRYDAERLRRAAGRPIIRESNRCGSCIWMGVLKRETKDFYVYAVDGHRFDEPLDSRPEKRVRKSNVHIEPCTRCTDHPKTHYPGGSSN